MSVVDDGKKEASMRVRSKRNRSRNIAIASVVNENFDDSNVIAALSSLRCYALLHGYPLEIVRETPQWRQRCPQTDVSSISFSANFTVYAHRFLVFKHCIPFEFPRALLRLYLKCAIERPASE